MGKLSVRLFAYESSEWNELNTRGVVRLSKEVAIEILGEKKLKHAIVLCVQGTWIVGKLGIEELQHALRMEEKFPKWFIDYSLNGLTCNSLNLDKLMKWQPSES